jgi:hypothetical protein
MIVRGEYDKAVRILEQLEQQPGIPQPLLNWVTLHEGLALLLAGKEDDSRKVFGRLGSRDTFGSSPEDRKLATFFITLGKQLESDQPQPPSVAKDLQKSTYESIALLLQRPEILEARKD